MAPEDDRRPDAADSPVAERQPLFRTEVLERRARIEPIDGLARLSSPYEWAILIAVALAFVVVAGWSLFGSLERTARVPCVMVQPGERGAVISLTGGVVTRVEAGRGDLVEPGSPVVRLGLPDLAAEAALARAQLAALRAAGADVGAIEAAAARAKALRGERDAGEAVASPGVGELVRLDVAVGDTVEAGGRVAVLRAPGQGRLEAVALLGAPDAARVHAGMDARVRLWERTGRADGAATAEVIGAVVTDGGPERWLTVATLDLLGADDMGADVHALAGIGFTAELPSWAREGIGCEALIVLGTRRPVDVVFGSLGAARRG